MAASKLDATKKVAGAKKATVVKKKAVSKDTTPVVAALKLGAAALKAVSTPAEAKSLLEGPRLKGTGGVILPAVGFGTYKLKKGEAKSPIVQALTAGYRLFDTAQIYENEADIGAALRETGVSRSEVCLETKVWRSSHGYERTLKACKTSLKRLNTDYIDVYLIHWPGCKTGWPLKRGTSAPSDWTPAMRDTGTWRAMEQLYDEGKVKAIGVANYSVRHLETLMKVCRIKPMVNQVEFHPRLVQSELLAFCKKHDIALQAYASLGSGDVPNTESFFSFPPVVAAAKAHQATPAQVLLRWALQKGALVIPKSSRPERMTENAGVFNFQLTAAEMSAIDALNQDKRYCWKGLDPDTVT